MRPTSFTMMIGNLILGALIDFSARWVGVDWVYGSISGEQTALLRIQVAPCLAITLGWMNRDE